MCLQGFELQDLTNTALRESVAGNNTGCLVIDVAGWTNAAEYLKKDDVVLSIDGHKLQNDKTIPFRDGDFIPYEFLWSYHFVNDNVTMEILRRKPADVVLQEGESRFEQLNISWEMQKR